MSEDLQTSVLQQRELLSIAATAARRELREMDVHGWTEATMHRKANRSGGRAIKLQEVLVFLRELHFPE